MVHRSALYMDTHRLMEIMSDDIADKLGGRSVQPHISNKSRYRYSAFEIASLVNSLAEEYSNSSWGSVVERMNHYQPDPRFQCTMAIINPFTSRLEWITVGCDEKYNISTILCEIQVSKKHYESRYTKKQRPSR